MLASLPKTFWMLINSIGTKLAHKKAMDTFAERSIVKEKMSAHEAYSPYRRSLY